MESGTLYDSSNYLSTVNCSNVTIDCSVLNNDSDSDVEIVKELKTEAEIHACNLCCEGDFLVNKLLQFGGVLTDELKFACEICDKGFKVKSALAKHMKSHLKEDSNQNTEPIQSTKPRKLKLQGLLHLPNSKSSSPNSSNSTSPTPLSCHFCKSQYKTKKSLGAHLRKKHSGLLYECEICKLKFSDFEQFKTHCKKHASLKN